jgi:hypothetical protein
MNKLICRNKLLFAVITVIAFLPIHNLFADWDAYYSSWDYATNNKSQTTSYWEKTIDCHAYWSLYSVYPEVVYYPLYDSDGFEMDGWVEVETIADVFNNFEEYSNSFTVSGDAELGFQEDWEWDGPPGEAPGADVDGYLSAGAYHYIYGERWPESTEAETDASSYVGSWAEAVVWDSGYGDDMCTVGMDAEGYVDSSDSDVDYSILSDPDEYDWDPDNDDFTYEGTLTWGYSSSIDYEVSSGLGWFSAEALVYGMAQSYVSIDADESYPMDETWAISESDVGAYASFSMTSNE